MPVKNGMIIEYDATIKRRLMMKSQALEQTPAAPAFVSPPVAVASQQEITPATPRPDTSALEAYMINFVVEQTGYPEDIVELDADLEGDLGIDSIKKVQLFAELGERFDVQQTGNLSPDDFPTLRHIVDFLAVNALKKTETSTPAAPPPLSVVVPATLKSDTSALEAYMINFVVEQTGYPEDIVELDADLEGDLGIDSIKKVQLFAELGERFDVRQTVDLSPDDFPTLRHIVDFLAANASKK